jgi:hypothetical protein
MAQNTSHHYIVLAQGKPIPPAYSPPPPHSSEGERMIHALEFIAERLAGIEMRIAALVQIQQGQH